MVGAEDNTAAHSQGGNANEGWVKPRTVEYFGQGEEAGRTAASNGVRHRPSPGAGPCPTAQPDRPALPSVPKSQP